MTEEQNTTTEEQPAAAPEAASEAASTDSGNEGLRRQLAEQGRLRKEAQAERDQLLEEKRARTEAEQLAQGEHEKVIEDLRRQLQEEKDSTKAADKARKSAELDSKLALAGATEEKDQFWLKSKYDDKTDLDAFVEQMKKDYPDSFATTPVTRSAGAHPAVSSTPSTGQEDLISMWNSKDNEKVTEASRRAIELNQKGLLDEATAKALGFK
jgi:hypothetical protein